nr:MAG TPA: hypothetical protein [Bacteriophage sp.]
MLVIRCHSEFTLKITFTTVDNIISCRTFVRNRI